MPAHEMTYVLLIPLVALILWRRVRRQFGYQPIRRKRLLVRIAIVAVSLAMLSMFGMLDLRLAEGLVAGVVGGAIVALVGLRLTRFEADPEKGDCYVPNPWFGAVLTALLLGRLAYRLLVVIPEMQQAAAHPGAIPPNADYSPLTMAVVGLLAGYYLVFYVGLLIHHRRFQASNPVAGTAGDS